MIGVLASILFGLFGPDAGFEQARQGESVQVWAPDHWNLDLDGALRSWNRRAGWRLLVESGRRDADITFHDPDPPNDGYEPGLYAVPLNAAGNFTLRQPYAACMVWVSIHTGAGISRLYSEHELGHCLGFAHRRLGIMGSGGWHPSDVRMLAQGGY